MSKNPLKELGALGQSIWLDYIRRDLISSGELRRLIEDDGLRGMTSNPSNSDLKYVESLIGPDTVNTVPVETFNAYREHGEPKARLEEDVEEARWVLERLPELGIDIDRLTKQLEAEGVEKFDKPFDTLMDTLEKRRSADGNR